MPQPYKHLVIFTDSSEEGGGGLVLQPQVESKTGKEAMKFIGHWGWNWTGARVRYPMCWKELLSGVPLLAAQEEMFKQASSIYWFCDASAVVDFLNWPMPTQKRRARWWYYLKRFPIQAKHVAGDKNEFADSLSRQVFQYKFDSRTKPSKPSRPWTKTWTWRLCPSSFLVRANGR